MTDTKITHDLTATDKAEIKKVIDAGNKRLQSFTSTLASGQVEIGSKTESGIEYITLTTLKVAGKSPTAVKFIDKDKPQAPYKAMIDNTEIHKNVESGSEVVVFIEKSIFQRVYVTALSDSKWPDGPDGTDSITKRKARLIVRVVFE